MMPLNKRCSEAAFSANMSTLDKEGYDQKQALAIAFSTLKKACGVDSEDRMTVKQIVGMSESVRMVEWKERGGMYEHLMGFVGEQQDLDGEVRRPELDTEAPPILPLDAAERDSLEVFVLHQIPECRHYKTAGGQDGIVYYDKRGRAVAAEIDKMDDGDLVWLAETLGWKRPEEPEPEMEPDIELNPAGSDSSVAEEIEDIIERMGRAHPKRDPALARRVWDTFESRGKVSAPGVLKVTLSKKLAEIAGLGRHPQEVDLLKVPAQMLGRIAGAVGVAEGLDEEGRGMGPGGQGLGPGGECVCPKCGYKMTHETGDPCMDKPCPKCGAKMTREELELHEKIEVIHPYAHGMWVIRFEDYLYKLTGQKWTWKKPILTKGSNTLIYQWYAKKRKGDLIPAKYVMNVTYVPGRDTFDVKHQRTDGEGNVVAEKNMHDIYIDSLVDPTSMLYWMRR